MNKAVAILLLLFAITGLMGQTIANVRGNYDKIGFYKIWYDIDAGKMEAGTPLKISITATRGNETITPRSIVGDDISDFVVAGKDRQILWSLLTEAREASGWVVEILPNVWKRWCSCTSINESEIV